MNVGFTEEPIGRREKPMSGITGISSNNYYTNYPGIYKNPAESAIAERTQSQVRGYDAGRDNMESGKAVSNIADGALGGIQDYLQSIREIAVKAGNRFSYTDEDRQAMQDQIEQYKKGISDLAGNTTYNEKKLLDGSNDQFKIAADGNGTNVTVSAGNATLEALGIKDFDVRGDFDLKTIDDAMEKISGQRSTIGAERNSLDHATAYNELASYNSMASFKEDDLGAIVKKVDDLKKTQALNDYQMMMQNKQNQNQANLVGALFA